MNLFENMRIALEALWGNRLRSFLALLGIVIGVFAVTALVSLGEMATAGITENLESMTSRSIFIQPNYHLGFDVKRLDDGDVRALSSLPVTILPEVMLNGEYEKKPGDRRPITLIGTPGNAQEIDRTIKLARGRYFTESEANAGIGLAVINDRAATEVFGNRDPLGRRFKLFYTGGMRAEVLVVGITEPMAMSFGMEPAQVMVPTPFLWRNHPEARRGKYEFLVMRLHGDADMKAVQKKAERLLADRHTKDSLQFMNADSAKSVMGNITLILQALLGAIASLSLLVGGIGIMNIMLVSVTERTREIGLRKALGATSEQIRAQFLIEAVVLTLLGGVLGVIFAAGMLWVVSATVPFLSVFRLNPGTVVLALGVSICVGLFFGVWPAARAAKLDPIESLRYE
jgi:putative ABC transport system permease protein